MRIAVFCDVFPELSETFIVSELHAMQEAGHDVTVVALARAQRPSWRGLVEAPVVFLDELPRARKARALAELAMRHPRRSAADAADRGRWRPDEDPRRLAALAPAITTLERWGAEHVHAHFAMHAALEALRVGKLLAVPVSITAHAYDIFAAPRNLAAKLAGASFTITGCAYNVRHLRAFAGPAHAERIHEVVVGVDAGAFRRRRPHPAGGTVLAVGRLVEKKGFADLLDACARLRDAGAFERLTIIGEGPLEAALRAQVARLGLQDRVELAGARAPEQVRDALEDAAVFALPCVVAADGDRDSMPVAVKEAMAMEVPVVATDEVGLPELVDSSCGRLVAPRNPAALAGALDDLLRLAPVQRAVLGRAGRERVLERCSLQRETGKLIALMEAAA